MIICQLRTLPYLRDQMGHVDDLRFDLLLAVDELWAEHGMDAAAVFLYGA